MAKPINPYYPKSPFFDKTCRNYNNDGFYNPEWAQKIEDVEVKSSDPQISVSKTVEGNKETFMIDFSPYLPPEITMAIVPVVGGQTKPNPLLLGETVDEIRLTWALNKAIGSQTLSNNGGLTPPSRAPEDRSFTYTAQSVEADIQCTISADDDSWMENSVVTAISTLSFGNYYYSGNTANLNGLAIASLQAILDAFNKDIASIKAKTMFATGGANQHFVFAYPKRFGLLTTIKKGIFQGGYVRMKNVAGVLYETVPDGGSEIDISISNGLQTEAYYVYMSSFDFQNDNQTPVEVS